MGIVIRVVTTDALHADGEMGLLDRAFGFLVTADIFRHLGWRGLALWQFVEMFLRQRYNLVMIHIAGNGEDHVLGGVVFLHIIEEGLTGQGVDIGFRAEHSAAIWLVGIGLTQQLVEHLACRVIAAAGNLLFDHFTLAVEFVLRELAALDHIGQNLDRLAERFLETGQVIGGDFL